MGDGRSHTKISVLVCAAGLTQLIPGEASHDDILPQLSYDIGNKILYRDIGILDIGLFHETLFRKKLLDLPFYDLLKHFFRLTRRFGFGPENFPFLFDNSQEVHLPG